MSALRAALARAHFDLPHLQAALHVGDDLSSRPADLVVYERRLREPSPLHTLARLFSLGMPVPETALAAALDPVRPADVAAMGLVDLDAGTARPAVRITPHGELLVACDVIGPVGPTTPLHVTGVNAPAGLLASLTVRRHSRRSLDVGTGGGIQALLAAHHSDQVVATDVNPRALRYAAFNAALNGVGNIEFRLGSLYEPVAGERFDLVVCNPPYVISPESSLVYRDSGAAPGALCAAVVGGAAGVLAEGGYMHALVSWPVRAGEPADAVPRSWIPDGVDAWILRYRTEDPLTHAAKWNPAPTDADVARLGEVIDEWLEYDRRQGIDEVAFGAIALRRRDGPPANLAWTTELHSGQGSAGPQLERVFQARAELEDLDDESILGLCLRLVDEHRLEQAAHRQAGGWAVVSSVLRLTEGIGFQGEIDGYLAAVVGLLDGEVTVGAAASAAGAALELSEGELEAGRGRAAALCRTLYGLGFMERHG